MNVQKLTGAAAGYLRANRIKLSMAVAIALGAMVVPGVALAAPLLLGDAEPSLKDLDKAMKDSFTAMTDKVKSAQDLAQKAMDEIKREGSIFGETNTALKKLGEENATAQKEFKEKLAEYVKRVTDLEQKSDKKPGGSAEEFKTAGDLFTASEQFKAMIASGGFNSSKLEVPRKAAILTPEPVSNDQPLVAAHRIPGIIMPPMRRYMVRDLLPQIPTTSNLIEFASELVFTNNAGPQYDASSPGAVRDGALKPESGITFQLANSPVITIAHYIPASRQMLADVPQLRGYIDSRLTYGLKLEEEDELLNGVGTAGKLNGLRNQATAFVGGGTNQKVIDTILRAFTQISLSEFEASGIVINPLDWQEVLLAKDNDGRYLFADPHGLTAPRIWGKSVVPTQAMPQGQFLAGAFDQAAAIYDREDVTVRTAEQHLDWFARNLIAILCEERLALVVYRPAAIIKGALNTPG